MSNSGNSGTVAERRREAAEETSVLLVDDEEQLRKAYVDVLEAEYSVRTAADGEAAVETMDDGVDVVLLDRRMPGLDGDEVLSELREDGYDVPVAVVSAVNPNVKRMGQQVDAYLFKPVGGTRLLETVEQLTASS